jgi:type IV pilus modification protein PilV
MDKTRIRKGTKKREQGYTLIEVLIGVALLSIGLLAVAQMQILTITTNTAANQKTTAITLAQDQLELLRMRPYSTLGNAPLSDSSGIYTRSWTVQANTPASNMSTVTVTVSWQGKQVQLQTIIASGNL